MEMNKVGLWVHLAKMQKDIYLNSFTCLNILYRIYKAIVRHCLLHSLVIIALRSREQSSRQMCYSINISKFQAKANYSSKEFYLNWKIYHYYYIKTDMKIEHNYNNYYFKICATGNNIIIYSKILNEIAYQNYISYHIL